MNRCEGCEIFNRGNSYRVCIPPPSENIRGCLISRDPTKEFLPLFEEYKQLLPDKKKILWFNAPPSWLCKKIRVIIDMEIPEHSTDMEKIQDFLNCECYWTHLQKCPTKPQKNQSIDKHEICDLEEDYQPFDYPTAKICATKWFESEFNKYCMKDKIIITLGGNVKIFFKQWSKDQGLDNSNKVIHFPHPSGRCRSWNRNADHTTDHRQ
jgi:hypothetical protein